MSESGNESNTKTKDIYQFGFDGKNYCTLFSLEHLVLQKLIANCETKVVNVLIQLKLERNFDGFKTLRIFKYHYFIIII